MPGAGKPLRVGLVFGGRSSEHEISIRSARSVAAALDRRRFEPVLIGIDHGGRWHLLSEDAFRAIDRRADEGATTEIAPTALQRRPSVSPDGAAPPVDVIFPILHGPFGEDGTVQGLLEMLDLPYVGAGVLGSAIGMDKDVQKRLLREAGLPVVPFVAVSEHEWRRAPAAVRDRAAALALPVFVKPANAGSSVGVHKVSRTQELDAAVGAAFEFDPKVLIEQGIDAREIECSVLGNDDPQASVPGEIVPEADFYSYDAKYSSESAARLVIPAALSSQQTTTVQRLAIRTFQALECSGMARVDFFLERKTDRLYVNELNSIPGFTAISMYPKLWEASGLAYSDLISRLIDLAIERHAVRARLGRAYAQLAAR
jgi:D-alanine-D-alanine ligase